ncbi:hypothetical protein [Bowmanella sp. JS7-9]|uniref:Phage shock protein B n=1 Tax=Pseudobowmanella zhangzhouensis TaxID=1537679 RepID=A0ABW1XN02_9ALTE|nr:hypothetical protein [Bowmanella sp. JS7-9]TBX21916.1 hypothetical protein TK45_10525 [Bowmanella sp. JS7-9]
MEISFYHVIVMVIALLNLVAVPFFHSLFGRINKATELAAENKSNLSDYKLHVAETFVTQHQLLQHLARIEKTLDELKQLILEQKR